MNLIGKIFLFSAFLTMLLATQTDKVPGAVGLLLIASIVLFIFWVFTAEGDDRNGR